MNHGDHNSTNVNRTNNYDYLVTILFTSIILYYHTNKSTQCMCYQKPGFYIFSKDREQLKICMIR